jgi:hypothetical protein
MKRLLLIGCWFFTVVQMHAQVKSFSVTADKEKIVIGEQFHLVVKVVLPLKKSVEWISIDSIPHFEIEEKPKPDSLEQGDELVIQQSITITGWDSGKWNIPSFSFGGKTSVAIPVTVSFSSFDPKQDYHDIKDVFEVKKPARTLWYWYLLLLLLLIVIVVLVFPSGKKNNIVEKGVQKPDFNAYKSSIDSLKKLEKDRGRMSAKEFYTQLKDILRTYLFKRKNMDSFSVPSGVLVEQIRQLQIANGAVEDLARTFVNADLAKFANYESAPGEMEESLSVIKNIIEEIENKS